MPQDKGAAYACQPSAPANPASHKSQRAATQESRLFNILSDQEIRSQFDQASWKKIFFCTTTQHAKNPRAKAAPKTDICDAHCWQPAWSPERVKNAVQTTTQKESYKEINKDHIFPGVVWKPEDTIRLFFQPPESSVSEYTKQYEAIDSRFHAGRPDKDRNDQTMRPLNLGVESDSHEHNCYRLNTPRPRPKLWKPFETEREMSKRRRHLRAGPQRTAYQAFADSPPKPHPDIRKILAGVGMKCTPLVVTHK